MRGTLQVLAFALDLCMHTFSRVRVGSAHARGISRRCWRLRWVYACTHSHGFRVGSAHARGMNVCVEASIRRQQLKLAWAGEALHLTVISACVLGFVQTLHIKTRSS